MLDPPPIINFLELRACSVRIKGRHALKWGSNTKQQYSIVARWRTSITFKLAVRSGTGAGGLVAQAPLLCTAYFGKSAVVFSCSLPQLA